MRVVFHAGVHKTGTTSVQRALQAHAPALAPVAMIQTRSRNLPFSDAAIAARAYSADPGPHTLRRLTLSLDHWADRLLPQAHQAILCSCEDFCGHIPSRYGLTDYRAAQTILPELAASLHRRFGPALDLHLLITTRAAEPWLRSIHWQLAKHHELTLKRRRFLKLHAVAADFGAVLTPLHAALGPVPLHVAPLEGLSPRRLGPVEALYDLAELPDALRATLSPLPAANASPPQDLADAFIDLNRSGLPVAEIGRIKGDMIAFAEALHRPSGGPSGEADTDADTEG